MNFWNQFSPYYQPGISEGQYQLSFPGPYNYSWPPFPYSINNNVDPNFSNVDQNSCKIETGVEKQEEKNEKISKTTKKSNIKNKNEQACDEKTSSASRNIKANILKDFVKSIKKDGTQILLAKTVLNSEYPIKKFIEKLSTSLPNEGKYIRTKSIVEICQNHEDQQFSVLLRIVLRNFLKGQYRNFIALKRKNKIDYLRGCRQILNKIQQSAYPNNLNDS